MTLAEVTPKNEVVVVALESGRGVRSHLNTLGIRQIEVTSEGTTRSLAD